MNSSYLIFQYSLIADDFIKYVFANMSINCREGVIQEVDVLILVHSTGQRHSLLLTSRQIYALQITKYQNVPSGLFNKRKFEGGVKWKCELNIIKDINSTKSGVTSLMHSPDSLQGDT